ncbi:MAG: sulfite exporter TauE/SafE family protein [Phycisphaerales bacterium]
MLIVFNVIVVALVLLIAYWWANQGVLSAILHLACVIAASGLAFATWEPLSLLILEKAPPRLQDYAWGLGLLGPFAVYLLLARVAADKLVPGNVNFPSWANMAFGGLAGFIAGVLTIGMCLLGGGFLQSSRDLMGFTGSFRTAEAKGQPQFDAERLWLPAHKVTAATFEYLGARALAPETGRSIGEAYPHVGDQAFSLHRDAAADGRARTSAPPDSLKLGRFLFSPDFENLDNSKGAYLVEIDVGGTAADSGGEVTVTGAQVRLIEDVPSGSSRPAEVAYPDRWSQPSESGSRQIWPFDDVLNVATNVPGQQSTKFFFIFPSAKLGNPDASKPAPKFLQFKGLRLRLPALDPSRPSATEASAIVRGVEQNNNAAPIVDPRAKSVAAKDLVVSSSIAPAVVSINELTTMEQTDQLLTEGRQEFQRGGQQASQANRIKGLYVREGTAMVRLNISRRLSSIDLWNDRNKVREKAGENATLYLVDSQGNQYAPVGYVWVKPDGVTIMLDPRRGVEAMSDFPNQPSSGSHELYALFNPTAGAHIVSIRLGNEVVANADLQLTAEK